MAHSYQSYDVPHNNKFCSAQECIYKLNQDYEP